MLMFRWRTKLFASKNKSSVSKQPSWPEKRDSMKSPDTIWEEGTDGHGPGLLESGEELRNIDLMPTYMKDGKSYGEWSAPAQSLLQKWLRDVPRKYVYLTPASNGNETNTKWVHNMTHSSKVMLYDTYEEALEAGLYEALHLI